MLRDAGVEYLVWAKQALARADRVSLLNSGVAGSAEALDVDSGSVLRARAPLFGDPAVRAAIASRYGVPEAEVFPALGTSMALFMAAGALLAPGDGVLVEQPGYESLWRVPRALGARVEHFPRREASGWRLEPSEVLSRWKDGTRVVLLTDLHNPTGCEAGDDAVRELAAEAARRDAVVLVDEVYRDARPGPVTSTRRLGENVWAISSLTKVYGMGDLRGGWVLAPPDAVSRLRALVDLIQGVDPGPIQPLIRRALERADALRETTLRLAAEGWAVVEDWSRGRPAPRITRPAAGIFAWASLPPGRTGTEVADRLLEDGVAVVPGRFFGDDSGFRFSFGIGDPEALREGLDAVARALA